MNKGRILLAQIIAYIPPYQFDKVVENYNGNYRFEGFNCWDQYV